MTGPMANRPSSLQFFSDCVRYNKPCILEGLASEWPAVTKWKMFTEEGRKYFKDLIGDYQPQFYEKVATGDSDIASRGFSYRSDFKRNLPYSEFLDVQKTYPSKSNIKDDSDVLKEKLLPDIKVPSFYSDVADLQTVVLYQGAHFLDKPMYEKQEQIMCAVDGLLSLTLVPHVYRQEVYAGDLEDSVFKDPKLSDKE